MEHRALDNRNGHLLILTWVVSYLCCEQRVLQTSRARTWKKKKDIMSVRLEDRIRLQVRNWNREKLLSRFGHSKWRWLWKKCWAAVHRMEAKNVRFFTVPLFHCFFPWQTCASNLFTSFQLLICFKKDLLGIFQSFSISVISHTVISVYMCSTGLKWWPAWGLNLCL